MKRVHIYFKTIVLGAILSFIIYSCKKDETTNDRIIKTGIPLTVDQERPFPTGGPTGSGSVDIDYTKSSKMLMFTVKWNGLLDSVTAMHFHGPAVRDSIAAPVFAITGFSKAPTGSVQGMSTLTADQEAQLLNGKFYVNIHTKLNAKGEIRGQVEF